jgi:hypothetical protein
MRRSALSIVLVAVGCSRGALPVPGATQQGLVAHEWGTYTSVQGSNGATLDGLQHEEEALPAFVSQRSMGPTGNKGFETMPGPVNQKLETPVIYFYNPGALHVRASVDFPGGIVSQWFPQASSYAPAIGAMTAIANGHMEWEADLRPGDDLSAMKPVPADSVWAPSRNTAAVPLAIGADVEKFIFYRGLGRFDVPFRVESRADGLLDLSNDSDQDIADVFLLRVHATGGATVPLGKLAARSTLRMIPSPVEGKERDLDQYVSDTMTTVAAALERSGLYPDEARAMVETWSRSYFRTPGLRVLYVAPRAWTDKLLPLTIAPTPQEMVRTLVGRVEVMTAADEQALVQRALVEYPDTLIASLGRFAEPKLRRARQLATDPTATTTLDNAISAASGLP